MKNDGRPIFHQRAFLCRRIGLTAFCLMVSLAARAQTPTGPQAGQKVAFLGDSITHMGWDRTGGYVRLVELAMKERGRPIEVIPAGISGNTSKDMLERFGKDVLARKPDWMTLSCGVNDVWHGVKGVPLDQYKTNIKSIVDQAATAGIKVVILTSTMIYEDQSQGNNQKLIAYNDFLRDLAAQDHLPLADLNKEMQAEVAKARAATHLTSKLLTIDGVHPNALGNEVMAAGILKTFGFTDAQIEQARKTWLDLPGAAELATKTTITARQYLQLQTFAAGQGKDVDGLLNDVVVKAVQEFLHPSPNITGSSPR